MRVLVFDTETTGLPETKILNPDKKRANKNKYTNELGETKAKVFI